MKKIEFYFDPISPYVWLSFFEIRALKKRMSVEFECIPTLFASLITAHESKGPAEIAAKRVYTWIDIMRLSKKMHIEFKSPPEHPFNPLKALRVCEAIDDQAQRFDFAFALTNATWGKGLDITREDTLKALLTENGLAAAEILKKSASDEVKFALKRNTARALRKNIFGVPSFVVDEEIFWGHDRLALLEDYLAGRLQIDHGMRDQILARPRGADRPFWARESAAALIEKCKEAGVNAEEYFQYFAKNFKDKTTLLDPESFKKSKAANPAP